jgi:hypothetical protein
LERRITVEAEEDGGGEEAGGEEAKMEAEAEEQEQQQHGPTLNFGDVLFGER